MVTGPRDPQSAPSTPPRPRGANARSWPVRRVALLEIGLFLAIALVVDSVWGHGDRFASVSPHPFWAIVLVMAAQYGTGEALLATAASSVALLAGHMPVQAFDQDFHQYVIGVLFWPLLWMASAVVLGELRGRHRLLQMETADRLADAERQVALLNSGHAELSAIKTRLETRLAGQLRTAAGVLEAGRRVDSLDPEVVLAGATELLRTALNARACSVFVLSGNSLQLTAAVGWADRPGLSDRYDHTSPLFREVVGAQRYLSVASPDGEVVLRSEGLMAGPLIDPATGTLFGMLKVEDMNFLDFTLSSLQTFKAVCTWIAAAYDKAQAHRRSQIEDETTHLFNMTYLDRQVAYLTGMARRFHFDLTLLQVQFPSDDVADADRVQLAAHVGDASRRVLRGTDLLFSHQPPGSQFTVLLPGATPEGAMVVARKLIDTLREITGRDLPCTTQVRVLHAGAATGTGGSRREAASGQVA